MYHAVWIFKISHTFHLLRDGSLGALVKGDGVFYKLHVYADTPVVYLLVQVVLIPHKLRDREVFELLLDG